MRLNYFPNHSLQFIEHTWCWWRYSAFLQSISTSFQENLVKQKNLVLPWSVFTPSTGLVGCWFVTQMDLGVGSFVFSLGLVSALPLLKLKKRNSFLIGIYIELKKSLGVLLLGCIRIIMVKGVDYPVSHPPRLNSQCWTRLNRNTWLNTASIGTSSSL